MISRLRDYPNAMSLMVNGVTRERRDDTARAFVFYAADGLTVAESAPYDASENSAADMRATAERDATNAAALRDKARTAIVANDAYLALVSPTNAQTVAQVQRLTRENTALIRLVIGALDTTNGT